MGIVKEEYESLNGTLRKGLYLYQSVDIDDSLIDSVSIKEAIDIYHNEWDSIIYFGANWCPWCRNVLPALIKYAQKHNQRITYVNMDNKRPIYIKDNDNFILDFKGDDDYQLLIDEFKDIMTNCVAKVDEELLEVPNTHNISLPLVVFGSYGTIKGYHYGTLPLKEDKTAYDLLDEQEEQQLIEVFETKNTQVQGQTCGMDGNCQF